MPNPSRVPITQPRVPFLNPETGFVSMPWYLFLLSLNQLTSGSEVSLGDLQKGPPQLTIDEINVIIDKAVETLAPSQDGLLAQLAELQKQVNALESQPRFELGTMAALQQDNVPWLQFDSTPSGMPTGVNARGTLYWDDAERSKTLALVMEDSGEVVQDIGEETFYRVKASAAITKGQVVMFTGTVGASGGLLAAPATGLTSTQSEYVMGIATQNIALNGWGYVTWFGEVSKVNTTGGAEAWVDGQILYYNPAVAGGLTKTVPTAPNPKVIVASVVNAATNGILFVRPTFGSALGQTDSNVQVGTLVNGNLLIYNASTNRWENATLTAGSNVTITNGPGSITIASSNPGGTVTSVGLSAPTGFSVSGSPVTSSGTLALSFAAGYSLPTNASQTNWDTAFSERRQWDGGSTGLVAATGRTSLGATTVGSNLFTLANPSAVTYMRINADNSVSTLDASTFRTAIGAGTGNGSVTSVATGTGLTGGPITGTGTISFSTAAVGTWVATPSSANLAAAMTDETGSGSLVFATRPSFANTIGVGGATAAASGAGMSFPAVASLSTDVNTLDDYEEGTWTPTYTPASGSFTSLTVVGAGRYVKIGKTVYVWMDIRTTGASTIGTASGILYITGLPFTVDSNGGYGVCSIFQAYNLGTAFTYLGVITEASTTRMYLTKNTSNGGVTYVQATEINTGAGNFNNLAGIFGMYQTAS
jgi:hypothetical protein